MYLFYYMNETINQTISAVTSSGVPDNVTMWGVSIPFTGSVILDIFLISLIGSLFITIVNKYMSDQVRIKALREEMKELRKQQKKLLKEKDTKKLQEFQQKMMAKSLENIKHSLNPKIMLITMVPMLFLFAGVRMAYLPFGEFLNLGFTQFGWLGTYIVFSIINSILLKKILDVA